jgi:MFS family permease
MRERLRVLRHPAFRNLWLASSASVMGDSIVIVALALFVTDLTGSATDVGIVLAAQMVPFVAFLLIGGVWADRLPRARLMITTDVVRMALHTLLAVLIFADQVEIWHLVVIEALFGTADAFFRPAHTGLVPRTVPEHEIQEAQALSNLTLNLGELLGPALATALVLGVGAGWAFLLDAATFAVSAWFLTRVRTADVPLQPMSAARCSRSSPRAFARSARAGGCGSPSSCSPLPSRSGTRRCSCSARRSPRTATAPRRSSGYSPPPPACWRERFWACAGGQNTPCVRHSS